MHGHTDAYDGPHVETVSQEELISDFLGFDQDVQTLTSVSDFTLSTEQNLISRRICPIRLDGLC